jgi:methylated-DNA-[protein]-cysteine S-methyltransferase
MRDGVNPQSFYGYPFLSRLGVLELIGIYAKNIGGMWFGVACDEQRVFRTCFANSEREAVKSLLSAAPFDVPLQVFSEPTAFAGMVLALVKDVYDGKGASRGLPLAMEHLSVYTRKVLEVTMLISGGYVASYGSVAEVAGGGARAVGNVMATNPFAPVVPCHRVVGAGFKLGGYGGGLKVKRMLLEREKRGYASQKEISVGEKKLRVFPVEFVLEKLG